MANPCGRTAAGSTSGAEFKIPLKAPIPKQIPTIMVDITPTNISFSTETRNIFLNFMDFEVRDFWTFEMPLFP